MTLSMTRRLYENDGPSTYNEDFKERGSNLITILLAELDQENSLKALDKIGCKIRGDKVLMNLDYAIESNGKHVIEYNLTTGESRYIERVRKGRKKCYWRQILPSKVRKNTKYFNSNISGKYFYLADSNTIRQDSTIVSKEMLEPVPEEILDSMKSKGPGGILTKWDYVLDKIGYLLYQIYSEPRAQVET